VLQVLLLAYMAGEREWILRSGRTIQVRTAPIDPDDPMRGEYLHLNYDFSSVPRTLWRDGLIAALPDHSAYDSRQSRDLRVFASLKISDAGIAELVALSDREPDSGLYLRGRVVTMNGNNTVRVRYGIEALFMQQGKARQMENMQRNERPGVPLLMEVAVGSSGIAVLKNYKWEPLGITVTFERVPAPARPDGSAPSRQRPRQVISAMNVELKNYGPEDVAVVDLPDGGSFRLVPNDRGWQEVHYRWVGRNQAAPAPTAGNVIVLKPGQSHTTRIDVTEPQWFVTDSTAAPDNQKPMALSEVTNTWSASFRIEYAPPDNAMVTGLPHAELIRHAPLDSRAFNANQGVD